MSPEARNSIGLNLTDKIIILDEAHNVEAFAESAYTTELSGKDLKNQDIL